MANAVMHKLGFLSRLIGRYYIVLLHNVLLGRETAALYCPRRPALLALCRMTGCSLVEFKLVKERLLKMFLPFRMDLLGTTMQYCRDLFFFTI